MKTYGYVQAVKPGPDYNGRMHSMAYSGDRVFPPVWSPRTQRDDRVPSNVKK